VLIINNHDALITYRFFHRNDINCLVGFDEGSISPGQRQSYLIPGVGQAKIDIWEPGVMQARRLLSRPSSSTTITPSPS
jgi:hypothetical protein